VSRPQLILKSELARLDAEGWRNACPRNTGLWIAAGWMIHLRRGDESRVVIVADVDHDQCSGLGVGSEGSETRMLILADADPDQFSGGSAGGAQEESGRRVPSPETFGPSVPPGFNNLPLAQQGLRLVPAMMLGRVCLVAAQGGSVANNVPGSIADPAHSGCFALKFNSSHPLQRNAGAVEPWDFLFLALGVLALGLLAHAGASLRHQTPGERERERLNGLASIWAVSGLLRAFRR
jgi:hypothetical protein